MLNHILIRNVSLYDAKSSRFSEKKDILIENGIITKIEKQITPFPGWEIIEREDLCVSRGWTDCHTHLEGFDPFLSYPSLGVTRIHDAGSFGAFNYEKIHDVIAKMPFPVTSYLYVGCYGVSNNELKDLSNLKAEPFYEVANQYRGEIIGAKIRIDPRVNCDTKKSLHIAKEFAMHANLPLIVHPSRTKDSLEDILSVMEKDDVYAHTYSPVAPKLFDENGKIKKCAWEALKRGVRFDLSHGSNNFSYDIARRAIQQGFLTETVSTDLHLKNYSRPGISLAGVMTKAIQAGFSVEEVLNRVIDAPLELLHINNTHSGIAVGEIADLTIFQIVKKDILLPDSQGNVENCEIQIKDVATVINGMLHHSIDKAVVNSLYWDERNSL